MKKYLSITFLLLGVLAQAQINTIAPGQAAPDFKLKNVDGKKVSFSDFPDAKGFIVVFTCNTCPVAKAYEQRIIDLDKQYSQSGFPVIAINANDASVSDGDSYDEMIKRAKSMSYAFPYLYDDGQKTTNEYGARNTPQIFLVKKSKNGNVIAYTGAIDNDPENNKSDKVNYLQNAVKAISENHDPEIATTKAIGCTVKRKKA